MPEISERYVRVKSLTFYNQTIHVHVDTDEHGGDFVVFDDDGNRLKRGTDWEQTIWKARGMLRRTLANVEIPFRTKDGRRGKALNIHSGTGNVTIQFPGERKQQIDAYEAGRIGFKPETTDEQIAEMTRLQRLINERMEQLDSLRESVEIDLHEAVKIAVEAKIQADDEQSWGAAQSQIPDEEEEEEEPI